MKNRIKACLIMIIASCLLISCGKKQTEYEEALANAPELSEEEKEFLEENWYGTDWHYYNDWSGEIEKKNLVIDEQYYAGVKPYIIKNCDLEYYSVDYELFDLDTGSSHGVWRDSIEIGDDGIVRIYSSSRTIEGNTASGFLFRKVQ